MDKEPTDLPLESRDALRLAAHLGESFSLPLLMDLGVRAEDLDTLFDEGLLRQEDHAQAFFASESLRQSVLSNTPWSQKRRWSLKIATAMERRRAAPELIAEHFLAAQNYAQARAFFVKAAESQCLKNDYFAALASLRRAFEIWPIDEDGDARRRVLKEMARCAVNTGDHDTAYVVWEELLEMARVSSDTLSQIEANRKLADLAAKRGDRSEVKQRLREAALLACECGEPSEEAKQWQIYAQFLADNVRLREAIESCDKALKAAVRAGDFGLQSEIIALSALAHAMSGKSREAFELIDRSIHIAIEHELPDKLTIAYRRKANVNEYSCNYTAYLKLETEALDRCRLRGEASTEQSCLSCLSYAFFRLGRWKQSVEAYRAAIEEMKVEGELLAVATAVKGCIAAFRGERRQSEAALGEALKLIGLHGGIVLEFHVHWARGLMAMLDGANQAAREAFEDLIALWRETEDRKDSVPGLLTGAMFFTDSNDPKALAVCIDILNTIASDNDALETRAASSAALAESAWLRGDVEAAIDGAAKAADGYEKQGLPAELALVSRRQGLMYASKGDMDEAQRCWRRSAEIARDLGMRPLLDQLAKDQRASGVSHSLKEKADKAGLTRRQLDVLKLVAMGQTNKEAAAALNLSPRTVEMHMASILDRLNCRARTEAIKKASELGLV